MLRSKHIARGLAAVFALLVALAVAPSTALADAGEHIYRLYNPNTGEHFYTASDVECGTLIGVGWDYEGVGWVAPTEGEQVYRLYNRYVLGGDHHYTTNESERDALIEAGWTYEEDAATWLSGGDVPLYRQYNPYAKTGTHNYTTSKDENDTLVRLGWHSEDIAWYGVAEGDPDYPAPDVPETSAPDPEPSEPVEDVVYWTPGGSVYHSTKECPALSRSRDIRSGSVADAQSAGKSRPCKDCH